MPAEGGEPKRLTYTATLGRDDVSDRMGPNNIVMGWTPDGKHIVFRSRMQLVQRLHRPALHRARRTAACRSSCRCRAAGSARTRPTARSSPTTASSASSAPGSATAAAWPTTSGSTTSRPRRPSNSPTTPAQDIIPMWARRQDLLPLRPRREQADEPLRRYDRDEARRQAAHRRSTTSTSSSRRWATRPSSSRTAATSTASTWRREKAEKVPVRILEDRAAGRGGLHDVSKNVTNFEISPDGKRALFGARGDVFTVPAKTGADAQPDQHARRPRAQRRSGRPTARRSPSSPTPAARTRSGRRAAGRQRQAEAAHDRRRHLQVRARSGRPTARRSSGPTRSCGCSTSTWRRRRSRRSTRRRRGRSATSPGRRTASGSPSASRRRDGMNKVYLYSLEQDKIVRGDRRLVRRRRAGVLRRRQVPVLRLRPRLQPDLQPDRVEPRLPRHGAHLPRHAGEGHAVAVRAEATRSDEGRSRRRTTKKDDRRRRAEEGPSTVKVDLDGSTDRVLQLPVAGRQLPQPAVGRRQRSTTSAAAAGDASRAASLYDLAAKKETALGTVNGFEISRRRQEDARLAGRQVRHHRPAEGAGRRSASRSNLSGMEVQLDRQAEWKQIFHECWRQMRDFFYDPGHARRRLEGDAEEVRAAGRARQPPGRPDLRHRRDDRAS